VDVYKFFLSVRCSLKLVLSSAHLFARISSEFDVGGVDTEVELRFSQKLLFIQTFCDIKMSFSLKCKLYV
jgi:hypothetical protein